MCTKGEDNINWDDPMLHTTAYISRSLVKNMGHTYSLNWAVSSTPLLNLTSFHEHFCIWRALNLLLSILEAVCYAALSTSHYILGIFFLYSCLQILDSLLCFFFLSLVPHFLKSCQILFASISLWAICHLLYYGSRLCEV